MIFSHYSAKLVESLRSVSQESEPAFKPRGFWISVDGRDDWKSWCKSNDFAMGSFKFRYRVDLGLGSKNKTSIMWLGTPNDILRFTQKYKRLPEWAATSRHIRCEGFIDWRRVAEDCKGIVIAPYQWCLRLDERASWYYAWDCASGCIWDVTAIKGIEMLAGENTRERMTL